MATKGDALTRGEITDAVCKHETDLRETNKSIEEDVEDIETAREVLDQVDLSGTAEGADAGGEHIEHAQDVSVEEYDRESEDLERVQDETEARAEDLGERSGKVSDDMDKIAEGKARMHGEAGIQELAGAHETAKEDVDFLDSGHAKQAVQHRPDVRRGRVAAGLVQSQG